MGTHVELPDTAAPLRAASAAAYIAVELLGRVVKARQRLDDPSDERALHDFRVAVRRLRTWLRMFRAQLAPAVPRPLRRRLRRLTRLSSASRDAEVQLAWLGLQKQKLPPEAREGLEWMLERIQERKRVSDDAMRRKLEKRWERTRGDLDEALAEASSMIDVDHDQFGTAASELVLTQARAMLDLVATIRAAADTEAIHGTRRVIKRLRYLVEPLSPIVDDADAVVVELKRLQGSLGELHDSHIMIEELTRFSDTAAELRRGALHDALARVTGDGSTSCPPADPALVETTILALATLLRARVGRAFGDLAALALGGKADMLYTRVGELAQRLRAPGAA